MKAAIYARVSTGDQNCEMQLRELREYLSRRGWETAGEYVDSGFSGAKTGRPQLDRLISDARQRRFDAVVVWKLDRWGRSLAHLVQSIQELSALGIRFVAVTQNIDTDESNPMARLLMPRCSLRAALVNRVNNKVGSWQLREWKHLGHLLRRLTLA